MGSYQTIVDAVLPVFLMVAAGVGLRKIRVLPPEVDKGLLSVTVNVFTPCLIYDSIAGNKAITQISNLLAAPFFGFASVAVGVLVGLLFASLAGLREKNSQRSFAYSVGLYNFGYLPIPLALSLFDRETLGILFVFNVGTQMAMWSVAVMVLCGGIREARLSHVINAPFFAVVGALLLNTVGSDRWMPEFVRHVVHDLGACAIPLGILLAGASLSDVLSEAKWTGQWRVSAVAVTVRLLLVPLLFLLAARYIPFSREIREVVILQAAMPAAISSILFAKHYGADTKTSLVVIISTTLVSLVTIPLWIEWGRRFLGV